MTSIDEGEQESDDAQSSASEPDAPSSVSDEVKKDDTLFMQTPEIVDTAATIAATTDTQLLQDMADKFRVEYLRGIAKEENPIYDEDHADAGPIVDDKNPLYDGNPTAKGNNVTQDKVAACRDWSDDEEILLDKTKLMMAPLRPRARRPVRLNLLPLQLEQDEEDSDVSPPSSPTPCNGERIDLCLRKWTRAEQESDEDIHMGSQKRWDEERGDLRNGKRIRLSKARVESSDDEVRNRHLCSWTCLT